VNNEKNQYPRHWRPFQTLAASLLLVCSVQAGASVTNPVIGQLLWSEEFNGATLNTATWTAVDGNGCPNLCGNGNAELQYYSPNNLSIADVPFEPGTRALAIRAQRQTVGSNAFTSGKVESKNKVQVQYGMIEIRMSTPNLTTGLWPAAWMLGTSAQTWPRNGEIDIMEMGHKASSRAAAGGNPSANNFVGSNVITWQQAACVPGNESCAASTAWQTKNWYVPTTSLANRFVLYRMYWTESEMRFTVVDNGVERNLYDAPLPVNSAALQAPFYLLLNMAVGGNFTDAATADQVTAPLPATAYVDYVRVYQLDGKGAVKLGNQTVPEVAGKFGIFTDTTAVNAKLVAGTSSDIFLWNGASSGAGTTAPYEGSNVIAWAYTTPGQWWGGGVQARQARDLTNYRNGTLRFRIKIPANVAFNIGVGDTYTNQNWVAFPANTTAYGLVRNGDWATATVPVTTLIGTKVALQSLLDVFMISSEASNLPASTFQFAIDDIVWDSGTGTTPPPPASGPTSVSQTSATTLQFTTTTGSWADVHYTVNNGAQLNVRMRLDGTTNTYSAGGLKIGDVVRYSFTYWDAARNFAVDTAQQSYTMQ
jgi:beta-glucanase (GH16 family)